jgi:hypothetical protein
VECVVVVHNIFKLDCMKDSALGEMMEIIHRNHTGFERIYLWVLYIIYIYGVLAVMWLSTQNWSG